MNETFANHPPLSVLHPKNCLKGGNIDLKELDYLVC